jgi:hypothetical protein
MLERLRGETYLSESKCSEASACFMALLGENPDDTDALKAVADLHKRSGDLYRALEVREAQFLY